MSYIGLNPQTQLLNTSTQFFSGNAVNLQFTLARSVASASDLDVLIGNVPQRPFADYEAENVSLVFQSAPESGTNNITVTYRAGALNSLNLTANAFGAGTVGSPSVYSVAANNTGLYWPNATTMVVTVAGGNRATFSSNVNSTSNTTGALQVAGGLGVTGNINTSGLVAVTNAVQSSNIGTGALTVAGGVGIIGNLNIGGAITCVGDFTVNGTFTTTGTDALEVADPFIFLANANPGDSFDTGVVSQYQDGANTRFTGYFRDITDGKYKLFGNLLTKPTTTVDTGNASFTYNDLILANLSATGNVTGTYIIGDGSLLTGISSDATRIFNGTSQVTIPSNNGNIVNNVNGITIATLSSTGLGVVGSVGATTTISAAGNITSGNVSTAGIVTATGNIISAANVSGSNLITGGRVVATANVVGGNITTTGQVTAGANVTGGNIKTAGLVSAAGDIFGNNFSATTAVNATGNVTGGNIITGGLIDAIGNITGGNVLTAGQLISTQIGSATTGTGQLYLNGTGNNRIDFNTAGLAEPALTTRSAGTKIVLYPSISASSVDYALGITAGTLWSSIPGNDAGQFFKWYGATTEIASLGGTGAFSVVGNVTGGNLVTGGLVSATGNITGSELIVTGNVTGGNISTGGLITATGNVNTTAGLSATGNVRGGNISTGGLVTATGNINTTAGLSATGNVRGGNVLTAGQITATGNVTGGNLVTTGLISAGSTIFATGNVTGGNILTTGSISVGGSVSATGNVTGGNINTPGLISATGNIINGIANVSTGNAIVTTLVQAATISATGNVIGANVQTGTLSLSGNVLSELNMTTAILTTGNITGGNLVGTLNGSGANVSSISATNISTGTLTQARLANASVTLGSTALTLGATVTTVAGLSSVTSTTFVGALTGAATTAGTVTTAAQGNITSVGTLTSLAVTGNISGGNISVTGLISATGAITGAAITGTSLTVASGTVTLGNIVNNNANGVGNIGGVGDYFNTVFAKATSAQYADLAEVYTSDAEYAPGTVVVFGGTNEVTIASVSSDHRVAGVVSTNPAHVMNAGLEAEHTVVVGLVGRVPTKVVGPVTKGDLMVTAQNGHAQACATPAVGTVIGKALESFDGTQGVIEIVVGRM